MSEPVSSYRDLLVWQNAMDLVSDCYRATHTFPDTERYGLTSQLQRAAVSVPANIAEGRGRDGTKEFIRHLSIANGSLVELETHLQIANRLNYLNAQNVATLLQQTTIIGKMMTRLKQSLRKRLDANP